VQRGQKLAWWWCLVSWLGPASYSPGCTFQVSSVLTDWRCPAPVTPVDWGSLHLWEIDQYVFVSVLYVMLLVVSPTCYSSWNVVINAFVKISELCNSVQLACRFQDYNIFWFLNVCAIVILPDVINMLSVWLMIVQAASFISHVFALSGGFIVSDA